MSIQYQAAAEILETLDGKIRPTGGRVRMSVVEVGGEPAMCFEYVSPRIRGRIFEAAELVPWLVLAHLKAPAALGDQVGAKWISQTRRAAAELAAETKGNGKP